MMVGGGQEAGWRSGTENMAGIAALGAVLDRLKDDRTLRNPNELVTMRDQLASALRAAFPGLQFNTPFDKALPTTLNFSVPGRASAELLKLFDDAGVHVSAGSACSSGQATSSHVLQAMQVPRGRSASAVRMSFGPLIDTATIAAACDAIARCGAALAAQALVPDHAIADGAALAVFLRQHPDATLVDVREAHEHAAGAGVQLSGRTAINVPMAQLSAHAAPWLRANGVPLVFICRSGQRARQAAASMRDQGHEHAWHLADGLTEAGAAPA
jgi:rhodanese-related sulfurtransferase